MWNYISTIYQGNHVSSSVIGKIRFNDDLAECLLLCRDNIIEIYSINNEDNKRHNKCDNDKDIIDNNNNNSHDILTRKAEIKLFENINIIKCISANINGLSDYFFILSNKFDYCFCKLDNGIMNVHYHGSAQLKSIKAKLSGDIKVITDIEYYRHHHPYMTNVKHNNQNNDAYYVALSIYQNYIYMIAFKFKTDGELIIDINKFINFQYNDIIDIIPIDRKMYNSCNPIVGILYSNDNINQYLNFQTIEIKELYEAIIKKTLWDIKFADDLALYKIIGLYDGALLTFSQASIRLYKFNEKKQCFELPISMTIGSIIKIPEYNDSFIISDENDGKLYLLSRGKKDNSDSLVSTLFGSKKLFKSSVNELALKYLGQTSIASTLAYIQQQQLFIGSGLDNSCIIQITSQHTNDINDPYIKKIYEFKHLGCISDMQIIQKLCGTRSLLTASDLKLDEQINLLNYGFNINLDVDLSNLNTNWFKNIINLYSVNLTLSNKYYLIISKHSNTYIFNLNDDNSNMAIRTVNINNFNLNERTIYAKEINHNTFVVLTKQHIYLIGYGDTNNSNELYLKDNIDYNGICNIIMGVSYGHNIIIATNNKHIQSFVVNEYTKFVNKNQILLDGHISAITINNHHVAVAIWDSSLIRIYNKDNLTEVYKCELPKSGVKSLKFINFAQRNLTSNTITINSKNNLNNINKINYLMCGMHDGSLYTLNYAYEINDNSLFEYKIKIKQINYYIIGSTPLIIDEICYSKNQYIFIGSDNNVLMSIDNNLGKISSRNVIIENKNFRNIYNMYRLYINNKEYLLMNIDNTIYIATLRLNDNILVKSLPLSIKDYANFICYVNQDNNSYYIVAINSINNQYISNNEHNYPLNNMDSKTNIGQKLTLDLDSSINPCIESIINTTTNTNTNIADNKGYSCIKIYDSGSFMEIISLKLEDIDIICMKDITIENKKYLLISGGYINDQKGIMILYRIINNSLIKIQQKLYDKYIIDINILLNNIIVISCQSTIRLIKIQIEQKDDIYTYLNNNLIEDSISLNEILVKNIDTHFIRIVTYENMILCLVPFKGFQLYMYNKEQNKLIKTGSSIRNSFGNDDIGCIIDENLVLISGEGKIKLMRRNKNGDHESEKLGFQLRSVININDTITYLKRDKIRVFQVDDYGVNEDNNNKIIPTTDLDYILYGTYKGNIGNIILLPEKTFHFLNDLQECILNDIVDINTFGQNYNNWRSCLDNQVNEKIESIGFIDGNILKRFLDYDILKMQYTLERMSSINKPSLKEILCLIKGLNQFV